MSELGRFGHHPDPAIDFCVEVDAIEGMVYDVEVALADKAAVSERIANALAFTVGGDASAINAKTSLRKLETRLSRTKQAEETIRYEDAAEYLTNIKGWVCKKCHTYFGKHEDMARYCCATEQPCPCGRRNLNKNYTVCEVCRDKLKQERWEKRPRVEWDGETPLVAGDRYFFSADDLGDWIANETEWPPSREFIEGLHLELCEECEPIAFELSNITEDLLPSEHDGDLPEGAAEVEKAVNDWLQKHRPWSWIAGINVVTVESVMMHLDVQG